ncbi:MAG: bifunctional metallophosphatase/5'-nucleotidase [Armatimonadetes bacterium]|nr:bifunctional metallophosphatase/5'-nucleotidase [Armatimonadota bacterium]
MATSRGCPGIQQVRVMRADSHSEPITVQILHTNDMHGALLPLDDRSILGHKARLGGSACLCSLIAEKRSEHPESTLLLDAGDSVHGRAETDLDEGRPMVDVMNHLHYDAGTIGNHDFQWGVPTMFERMDSSNYPYLVANVEQTNGSEMPNTQPYKIFEREGVKIGVVGLLTKATEVQQRADRLQGVHIESQKAALGRLLPEMKKAGADVIVVLTHVGLAGDEELARAFPDQNLFFVGGHSHDRIAKPIEVAGNHIVQAGAFSKELGVLTIELDPGSRAVVGVDHQLIPVDPQTIPGDQEVAKLVERYRAEAEMQLGRQVTTLGHAITRSGQTDSRMGNLVTDAMREAAEKQSGRKVDLAFMNSDGLRTELDSGPVTLGDLYEMMPFGGELMVGSVRGDAILRALEHSVKHRPDPDDWHTPFLQMSGAEIEYAGDRLLGATIDGQPIDAQKTYTVALEDYLTHGGLGYTSFKEGDYEDASMTINDAVRDYFVDGLFNEEATAGGQRIHDLTTGK